MEELLDLLPTIRRHLILPVVPNARNLAEYNTRPLIELEGN